MRVCRLLACTAIMSGRLPFAHTHCAPGTQICAPVCAGCNRTPRYRAGVTGRGRSAALRFRRGIGMLVTNMLVTNIRWPNANGTMVDAVCDVPVGGRRGPGSDDPE